MRLWTIQKVEAFNEFKGSRLLRANHKYIYGDFLSAHKWMSQQMKKRLNTLPPEGVEFPVWAWYQWSGDDCRKPDLRFSGYLPKGQKAVRIEFEVPEDKVLLSDFDNYHGVLNYWLLPEGEEEHLVRSIEKYKPTLFNNVIRKG